jgi:phage baseplate assembly protein W|tara:strand:- start:545 stop:964 length:420 start_codon:yes stop_codon:yes gene_type:complete
MALKNIDGSDFKRSRRFDDVNISLPINPFTKDIYSVKNENAIKQSIKNLVLTVPGEKPFQPLVGSRVNELLFEPLDPFIADSIKDEIINTIKQNEPRVDLTEVTVLPLYEQNKINVSVEYRIVGLPIVESITFVLQRPE